MKFKRWIIEDTEFKNRYLWGFGTPSGVGFENDTIPRFWELCEDTILFKTEERAKEFKKRNSLNGKIHTVNVTINIKK